MNEEQLKPITNESNELHELKEINLPKKTTGQEKIEIKQEVITNLPSWSIEPPLEIKRGN